MELADPPNETTLKAVASSLIKGFRGDFNISNVSVRKNPSRNSYSVTFSVNNKEQTVLMVKEDPASNEVPAYATLFKAMQNPFLTNYQGDLYELIPRPVLNQKPYLFTEDFYSAGFKTLFQGGTQADPSSNLDFNHCLLIIETLARFHASSYLLRRQLGEKGKGKLEMLKKYPFINPATSSGLFYSRRNSSKLGPVFEKGFELACRLIEMENPSLAFKLQRKIPDPSIIFDKVCKLIEEEKYDNDDFYLVCHGSFLSENVLFTHNKHNEPVECKIINLGSVHMAPLATDLVLFMLTSTNLKFREQFEEKLLAFYCDAFQEYVLTSARQNVNGNEELITEFEENIDEFHIKLEKQYKKMLEFGFYHACLLLPMIEFRKFGYSKTYSNKYGGDNCWKSSTLNELVDDFQEYIVGNGFEEFERFAVNSSTLHERLVGVVKQLVKMRVLF